MIGELVAQVLDMFATFVGPVVPYLLGLVLTAAGILALAVAWWLRPTEEADPTLDLDPRASDWLGEP
jgi:hypothetical protein|tara:strand:- start:343 stop:543 length:201 start_codon:yes stop_codon:yes gene_type:complete